MKRRLERLVRRKFLEKCMTADDWIKVIAINLCVAWCIIIFVIARDSDGY